MRMTPRHIGFLVVCSSVAVFTARSAAAQETQDAAPQQPEAIFGPAVPEGVPSLQISTDFVSPELAFGDYATMGQVQSRGIRVSPFTIRAAVQTAVGYTDNVTLTDRNTISSAIFNLSPSIAVGLEGSTQRYHVVYRGTYGVFASSSADNYAEHNLGITAGNDWTARLPTFAGYDFFTRKTPRGATGKLLGKPPRWELHPVRRKIL